MRSNRGRRILKSPAWRFYVRVRRLFAAISEPAEALNGVVNGQNDEDYSCSHSYWSLAKCSSGPFQADPCGCSGAHRSSRVGGRLDYETDTTGGPTLKVCTQC